LIGSRIYQMSADKMKLRTTRTQSEERLIAECKRGKSKAQKELYDCYSSVFLGICVRYVKNLAEAEDIMIKGFMKVFQNLDRYEGKGSFEGWMKRIIINESLMYLRKNKSMYLEVDIDYADREPDYHWASTNLEVEDLHKMIEDLPMGYRTIFNLYAIEGYSHKEIAEMLEINENTSKSQLSRARAILQKKVLKMEEILKKDKHERV